MNVGGMGSRMKLLVAAAVAAGTMTVAHRRAIAHSMA